MVNNLSDFICNQLANSKCLDYAWINKTARENKKLERTFTINKEDVPQDIIENMKIIATDHTNKNNIEKKYIFKVFSNIKEKSLINWCYILLKENELKKFINNKIIRADSMFYKRLVKLDKVGELLHFTPKESL